MKIHEVYDLKAYGDSGTVTIDERGVIKWFFDSPYAPCYRTNPARWEDPQGVLRSIELGRVETSQFARPITPYAFVVKKEGETWKSRLQRLLVDCVYTPSIEKETFDLLGHTFSSALLFCDSLSISKEGSVVGHGYRGKSGKHYPESITVAQIDSGASFKHDLVNLSRSRYAEGGIADNYHQSIRWILKALYERKKLS